MGALARLRRASLLGAMTEPATIGLFQQLAYSDERRLPVVALCAGVLACVRADTGLHPARTLGTPPGGKPEEAKLKPLRFRRLMETEAPDDLLAGFRRAVQLAGGTMGVRDLAFACLHWTEGTRRTWIFTYYNAGAAAPAPDTEEDAA
jgi:CRISPR type I-E-associated protein CasB/Cse2